MEIRKISTEKLGESLGTDSAFIRKIINGSRRITPLTALRLERAMGINPIVILGMQNLWDLARLDYEDFSAIHRLV